MTDLCKCSCHKTEQSEAWPIGKMVFCDCDFPHETDAKCKTLGKPMRMTEDMYA